MRTNTVYHIGGPGYLATVTDKGEAAQRLLRQADKCKDVDPAEIKRLNDWVGAKTPSRSVFVLRLGKDTYTIQTKENVSLVEFTGKRER